MRGMLCLMIVLQGCASPAVRCDAHLVPINAPAAKSMPGSGAVDPSGGGATGVASSAATSDVQR